MSGFVAWLEGLNQRDTKVRAVLRRSLAFDPGIHPAAFPYVEPFLATEDDSWRRTVHYLVAGLWAQHWKNGRGEGIPLGKAAAIQMNASQSKSTEQRFVALLDSDEDQLPYRLRQMIALLKDQNIDFEDVLKGLVFWNSESKRTQMNWVKDFYRTLNHKNTINEEISE
jgi:CRISPR system Cascade subunit CasB